eukprot:CAMPEP_0176049112 /NCGR_PEP_ID=MMETSP0120_2-20121206/24401_1 /TAXON_ID=160619 /ORGANISM="Kryptoperidinium foliaceum, Strain CCMP 1326" /LENGTH=150 /DNA_ID=CAMNT_0017382535 /DNA_START=40 /DNA_END=489 /DNA_ORIENTATION=+
MSAARSACAFANSIVASSGASQRHSPSKAQEHDTPLCSAGLVAHSWLTSWVRRRNASISNFPSSFCASSGGSVEQSQVPCAQRHSTVKSFLSSSSASGGAAAPRSCDDGSSSPRTATASKTSAHGRQKRISSTKLGTQARATSAPVSVVW